MAEIAREMKYALTTKKGGKIMKKMQSLYKQKRKIVLTALLILPCICMACGLKVVTHQLDPEAVSQGNYATIVYDKYEKFINIYYKLSSFDGKMVEVDKYGSDYYQVKPGLHTLAFEKREVPLWRTAVDKNFTLHKNDIIFEAVPGGKYKIVYKKICASEETEGEKSLDFFIVRQVMIEEADSGRIVSKPIAGEFQPSIGKETIKISWKTTQIPILHLYNGTKLPKDKIVGLKVVHPGKGGVRIETILGETIDGTKISFQNFDFVTNANRVTPQLKKNLEGGRFAVFALLPGTYLIEVRYHGSKGQSVGNTLLPLNASAGNSYVIDKDISISGYKIKYFIKNVTGEENEE